MTLDTGAIRDVFFPKQLDERTLPKIRREMVKGGLEAATIKVAGARTWILTLEDITSLTEESRLKRRALTLSEISLIVGPGLVRGTPPVPEKKEIKKEVPTVKKPESEPEFGTLGPLF